MVVCQTCGVKGFSDLLIYCAKCKTSAEHRYCLSGEIPRVGQDWFCEQCVPRASMVVSLAPTLRGGLQKEVKYQLCGTNKTADSLGRIKHENLRAADICLDINKHHNDISKCLVVKPHASASIHVSKTESSDFKMMNALETLQSCDKLPPKEENAVCAVDVSVKDVHLEKQKRKFIFYESDEEAHPTKDKEFKGHKRKLILFNEDHSDEEATSNSNIKFKSQWRRFRLYDEGHSDEEALSGKVGQSYSDQDDRDRGTNKSLLALSSLKYAIGHATVSSAHTRAAEPNFNRSRVVSFGGSESQDTAFFPNSQDTNTNISCLQSTHRHPSNVPARPVIDPIWRGSLHMRDGNCGPLVAHLSCRACVKVSIGAQMLPQMLCVEMLSRLKAWPKSFQALPPSDDHIGLYFFPGSESVKVEYNQLIDDVREKDIVMRVMVEEADLLIFSSTVLPKQYHKFLGQYYLWGVFRGRKSPVPAHHIALRLEEGSCPKPSELAVEGEVKEASTGAVVFHVDMKQRQKAANWNSESFPLQEEDISIKSRTVTSNGLDLELGLMIRWVKPGNPKHQECNVQTHLVLGRAGC